MKRWFEQRHAPKPGSYLCDIAEVGESQVRGRAEIAALYARYDQQLDTIKSKFG